MIILHRGTSSYLEGGGLSLNIQKGHPSYLVLFYVLEMSRGAWYLAWVQVHFSARNIHKTCVYDDMYLRVSDDVTIFYT